jgi:drug/metabolite transporter (DMT)-like permease
MSRRGATLPPADAHLILALVSDEVVAVILAIAAAVSWGFSASLVRMGLRYLSTATGTLISLVAGCVLTLALVLIFELDALTSLSAEALALFAVIGVLNFPLGRFLNYMSVARLGVGRSTPILASSPLFAMVLAVIFTSESVSVATFIGTALILSGLYITLRARTPPRPVHATTD